MSFLNFSNTSLEHPRCLQLTCIWPFIGFLTIPRSKWVDTDQFFPHLHSSSIRGLKGWCSKTINRQMQGVDRFGIITFRSKWTTNTCLGIGYFKDYSVWKNVTFVLKYVLSNSNNGLNRLLYFSAKYREQKFCNKLFHFLFIYIYKRRQVILCCLQLKLFIPQLKR